MEGASAERLTSKEVRDEIFDFLRYEVGSHEDAVLFRQMMIHFRFILNVVTKKNEEPFNDQFLRVFKRAYIEFLRCYELFQGRVGQKHAKGHKVHYGTHIIAFLEYFRYSPAHMSDNRCEAFNRRLRKYWNIFSIYMSETNLLKMMCTMVRQQQSYLDEENLNTAEQQLAVKERILELSENYYPSSKASSAPTIKEPRASMDLRYKQRKDKK
jgi:hypothetical protein